MAKKSAKMVKYWQFCDANTEIPHFMAYHILNVISKNRHFLLITINYHNVFQLNTNVKRGADRNRLYINIPKIIFWLETKNVIFYAFESGLTLFWYTL